MGFMFMVTPMTSVAEPSLVTPLPPHICPKHTLEAIAVVAVRGRTVCGPGDGGGAVPVDSHVCRLPPMEPKLLEARSY